MKSKHEYENALRMAKGKEVELTIIDDRSFGPGTEPQGTGSFEATAIPIVVDEPALEKLRNDLEASTSPPLITSSPLCPCPRTMGEMMETGKPLVQVNKDAKPGEGNYTTLPHFEYEGRGYDVVAPVVEDDCFGILHPIRDKLESGHAAEHEVGYIRATLLVNFGDTKHNKYGFTIEDNGTTHALLIQVLEKLTKQIFPTANPQAK